MTDAIKHLALALQHANRAMLAADGWVFEAETWRDPDGHDGVTLADALYIARVRRERRKSEEFDPYLAAINSLEISLITAAGWATHFRDGSLLWRSPIDGRLVGIRDAVRIVSEGEARE